MLAGAMSLSGDYSRELGEVIMVDFGIAQNFVRRGDQMAHIVQPLDVPSTYQDRTYKVRRRYQVCRELELMVVSKIL